MAGFYRLPQFRTQRYWIPTFNANVTIQVTPGDVTWSGQTATTTLTVPVTAGDMTWTGQTVTVTITTVSLIWSPQYQLIHR